ncbi:nucleoporin complex subunit 54-domain-containing protein [Tuber borchii]|uniref:Nucleoporin complex subunit 54-domain-containing protein n=1 Tax=Tuber borchii TaxID=42251 RepID=A0A2T6ZKF8_TUBBO|nr:nucleoporin complex subunit 54-domain-containing protein [Tuber borchii]
MSLFGSNFGQPQQQQQQSQGGGLFGQSTAQQPQQGGGLFGGATQQQQSAGGGLFGNQQPQQQQQQQQGGLFGKPSGPFGQSTPTTQQGSGLFGGGQSTQQSAGGGLFGGGGQQNTGGGMFGGQQQQGGLFGGGQSGQPTGGGLFGGQSTQQPQQQFNQQGGSLFGQSQPGGGGLFGQTQSQPQQQQQGGLFGNSTANQGQQQGSYMNSTMGGYGQQSMFPMMSQSMQVQQQSANVIVDKLGRIKNAWDTGHPDYAFKYYLYNHVGEDKANMYQKPPADDLAEWEKAWAERPNKGSVPVLAKGFKDLDHRVKSQEQQVNLFRHRLHEIQDKLAALQSRHDLMTSIKLEDCRRRHTALSRRALSLAAKVQVMKNRGYALQPEEEQLKKRLEALSRAVWDPAVRGRVNEIWARMMVVSEQARMMEATVGKVEIVWDEKQLQTAGKLLQTNAAGLEHLNKEIRDIEKAFDQWEEEQKSRPRGF